MKYSITEIAKLVRADFRKNRECAVSVLLTDSRSLTFPEETLFFALATERNDGHRYVFDLYRKGVCNFVVSRIPEHADEMGEANFLVVPDTLQALQALAAAHRRRFKIPVIGVAGSNGKTVVKEWLYQLLCEDYTMVRSPRSYNSQIGVPLSVWEINEQTELAVIEAGISKSGEMDKLEPIVQPTVGILTNVGEAHQEGFSTIQEKCEEKLSLFRRSDAIIYDGDDPLITESFNKMCMGTREIAWSHVNIDSPLYISKIEKEEMSTRIEYIYLRTKSGFTIPFVEDGAVQDAIHCLAVMLYLGTDVDVIARRMSRLEPIAMRMEVKEGINNCLLINDSYNSDINSLGIALDFQSRRSAARSMRRTLILSDILQSGVPSDELYERVASLVRHKGVQRLVGIGYEIMAHAACFNIEKEFYATTEEFLQSGRIDRFSRELILIKGARRFHFESVCEALELKQHETILEVNLDAIVHNYNFYKEKLNPSTRMICMVKAFGYGAGSYELAKTLQDHGCDYLAVAVADEGAELRKQGITMPIMVMNPEMSSFHTLFRYDLEPEVYSFKLFDALLVEARRQGLLHYPVHIKIDSGMHRLGFEEKDMPLLAERLSSQDNLSARSVFSHFAGSDEACFDDYSRHQIALFTRCADAVQAASPHKVLRHILNTAGITRFTDFQFDAVRLGIGLYGVSPYGDNKGLRTVSTLKTTILQIRDLAAGETVGYSRRGVLERPSRIAAIPIGYADGLDRHLGNGKGCVVVNGKRAPIVGNICMDVTLIDVTDIDCREGDRVEIFGEQLPVEEMAGWLGTIPYEILTSVSSRVKRVYYRE